MDIGRKRVLITGGSSGIGLALAHALAARGARLVLSGRRADAVQEAVSALGATGAEVHGVVADVATAHGRAATLRGTLDGLGGLDVLVNNAGNVRAGRLETMAEDDILAMLTVDLIAPILLTRAALPALRAGRDAMVVNVASGFALIGAPFYSVYCASKAGLAHFGEALRRELKGEGIHVLTAYPGPTDTPMMATSRAGPELGVVREPAAAVAEAIVDGMLADAFEVIRGGEPRAAMIRRNREDPGALDARYLALKPALEDAVRDHVAL